jgi:hypothetical protein
MDETILIDLFQVPVTMIAVQGKRGFPHVIAKTKNIGNLIHLHRLPHFALSGSANESSIVCLVCILRLMHLFAANIAA